MWPIEEVPCDPLSNPETLVLQSQERLREHSARRMSGTVVGSSVSISFVQNSDGKPVGLDAIDAGVSPSVLAVDGAVRDSLKYLDKILVSIARSPADFMSDISVENELIVMKTTSTNSPQNQPMASIIREGMSVKAAVMDSIVSKDSLRVEGLESLVSDDIELEVLSELCTPTCTSTTTGIAASSVTFPVGDVNTSSKPFLTEIEDLANVGNRELSAGIGDMLHEVDSIIESNRVFQRPIPSVTASSQSQSSSWALTTLLDEAFYDTLRYILKILLLEDYCYMFYCIFYAILDPSLQ
jgi:hypothetical protein